MESNDVSPVGDSHSLRELARLFVRLGFTAFGGPAAHIAIMEDEVVNRRRWLSREKFLDLLGATNLIPGPNSTEMAIHIGYLRGGGRGLLVAGACFIIPAMLLVLAIAWGYVRFGNLPETEALLYGVKPVIIAIVLQALVRLGGSALKTKTLALLSVVAAALNAFGLGELWVLFGAGAVMAGSSAVTRRPHASGSFPAIFLAAAPLAAGAAKPFGLWPLFWFFLKVGSVLFGSGYVLLAFLRADLVERWGWLTESQLIDAIAVSQVTPGPVFTAATFIGYVLGGFSGALVATLGIFLPAFAFVALSGPLIPRIRKSPTAGAFLDGVIAASLALMAVVTVRLSQSALVDVPAVLAALASAFLLLAFRVNSVWLILGGAAFGLATRLSF